MVNFLEGGGILEITAPFSQTSWCLEHLQGAFCTPRSGLDTRAKRDRSASRICDVRKGL